MERRQGAERIRLLPQRVDGWSRRLSAQIIVAEALPVCGIEHEFEVWDGRGRRLDARALLPELAAGRRRQDPIDPHARMLPDGAVLTADGREAEIAIAPVSLHPGFSDRAIAAAASARAALEAALPPGSHVAGYSTHLSVQVTDRRSPAAARFVAERLAPLLMLGLETPASPGLLIRARWNRVEIGGDYVDGDLLRAALVVAVACVRRSASRGSRRGLPSKPAMGLAQAVERYGWYVDRNATGSDLYTLGRAGVLRCGRSDMTVQEYVSACWTELEPGIVDVAGPDELERARNLVEGRLPSALDL